MFLPMHKYAEPYLTYFLVSKRCILLSSVSLSAKHSKRLLTNIISYFSWHPCGLNMVSPFDRKGDWSSDNLIAQGQRNRWQPWNWNTSLPLSKAYVPHPLKKKTVLYYCRRMFLDYATMPGFTIKVRVGLSTISSGLLHSLWLLFFLVLGCRSRSGGLKNKQTNKLDLIYPHISKDKKIILRNIHVIKNRHFPTWNTLCMDFSHPQRRYKSII